ncbi:MAG: hypothetical protein ABJ056_01100 [Halioglobus sp.]
MSHSQQLAVTATPSQKKTERIRQLAGCSSEELSPEERLTAL